ncbi:MAG: ankyrin repeat domain-containing protein [Methyloprofundus sp.]|nr:ankyrin repeat domain-containing protein [Methyloprofundus sp.]
MSNLKKTVKIDCKNTIILKDMISSINKREKPVTKKTLKEMVGLVRNGADPTVRGWGGSSVLELALLKPEIDLADELIDLGADIYARFTDNLCLLRHLVLHGSIESIHLIIERGCDLNVKYKFNGETPIFLAVREQNIDALNLLLNNPGVDLLAVNDNGETLLDVARNPALGSTRHNSGTQALITAKAIREKVELEFNKRKEQEALASYKRDIGEELKAALKV